MASTSPLTPRRHALARFLLAASLLTLPAIASAQQGRIQSGEDPLQSAMHKGDYELAKQISLRHDDTASLLVRARLARMRGELELATRMATLAVEKAADAEQRHPAQVMLASLQTQQGDWQQAVTALREELKRSPDAHDVRIELGRTLWEHGERKEAEQVLDQFGELFNNGRIARATHLAHVGESMQILGNFQDADYAFTKANKADPKDAEVLVRWGNLFLEKYNARDARRCFEEALAINPNLPEALLGMASLTVHNPGLLKDTVAVLDHAEKVAPGDPDLWVLRALLSLRDEDYDTAKVELERARSLAPQHLDTITLMAIRALVLRDQERYAMLRDELVRLSPGNGDPLAAIAEFVSTTRMEHEGAIALYKEALAIEPENANALMGLGFALLRDNHDDEALGYFQRAFDLDPYNARVYLVLELYDKVMPRYSFKEYDHFKLRTYNEHFEVVDLFVSPVIRQARELYDTKYHFTPSDELAVELYPDASTFSIRSLGVPFIGAHGLCFGNLVTMHSPAEGNFNWRMVLWHELAHVYHIQISNSRVPRWFTEGLAEYETNVHDPSWRRYHDESIAQMLADGTIPGVLDMSKGFTHTQSQVDVVRAYHLSSLAIHFIVKEWGFESVVQMLRAWGQGISSEAVLAKVLNVKPAEFDARFKVWLERYLIDFHGQLTLDFEAIPSIEETERQLKLNRKNPKAHIAMMFHALRAQDLNAAELHIAEALAIAPDDPEINYPLVYVRTWQGRAKDALMHGERVLAAFKDSYTLRVMMGQASLAMEDVEGARVHFDAALQLNPNGAEVWGELAKMGVAQSDDALWSNAVEHLYMLDAHDPTRAAELYQLALKHKDASQAMDALHRWQDTAPFDARLHRAMIEQIRSRKDAAENAELARAYRALIVLSPAQKKGLYEEAISAFEGRGMSQEAERFRGFAKDDGVSLGQ